MGDFSEGKNMVALLCLFLLLPQQKAGQTVMQLSFNHQKQDTLKTSSLLLIKWTDVRKDGGWYELCVQPAGAKGWQRYDFVDDTKQELRLSKGFVYNVMVLSKDRNGKLVRTSKLRKIIVRF